MHVLAWLDPITRLCKPCCLLLPAQVSSFWNCSMSLSGLDIKMYVRSRKGKLQHR
ncbi:hypothetical protein BDP67DRAFT_534450 [Colletotrichum lupini]|nr:hypothetical protein BDP67DRAFT_534450 [Colletotrichum lupini]